MGRVNEEPEAIDRLRQALPPFLDRQTTALRMIDREIQLTELALQDARQVAEREVQDCNRALQACIMACYANGAYPDCGPERWALVAAEHRLGEIIEQQRAVDIASDQFNRCEQQYLSYLSSALPAIEAGLQARVVSLEAYLAWKVSPAAHGAIPSAVNASRLLGNDLAAKLRYGALRPNSPTEARESGQGGPEKVG